MVGFASLGSMTFVEQCVLSGKPEQKTIRIGLHVRAETGSNAPEHFYCLDSLISMYKEQNQNYIILLVTAAKGIQDTALAKYGDKVTFPMGKPDAVVVVDHRADADIDPSKNVTMESEWLILIMKLFGLGGCSLCETSSR